MKKKIILALVLVLLCASVSAVDLGHIGVSTKGLSTWTATWKDGLTDGLNINIGITGSDVYIGGQWHVLRGGITNWLGFHAGPGIYASIGNPFVVGGELLAGLDFWIGPIELFFDYGIEIGAAIGDGGADMVGPSFNNFSGGIRIMLD